MPLYDYKCTKHGYFTLKQNMTDHARGTCPTCKSDCKQVILTAPAPLIEAMADAGCPGAFHTSGDRMTRRHYNAGQYHKESENVAAEAKSLDHELARKAEVMPST